MYRHILREAWRVSFRNRMLWPLGLLAVGWGGIGVYQSFNRTLRFVGPALPTQLAEGGRLLPPFEALSVGGFAALLLIALLVLGIIAALVVLATSGRGALIWACARRYEGKSARASVAFKKGTAAFWPILGIAILSKLDLLLYIVLLDPLIEGPLTTARFALYIIAFVGVTLVSLLLGFLGMYASALVMLEGHSMRQAIFESFALFVRNWLVSLELALILYLVSFVVGVVVLAGLAALTIPFILLSTIATSLQAAWAVGIVGTLMILIYVAGLALAGSIFVVFQYATWVLLYLRIRDEGAVAKVVRLTARFAHILHQKIV